MVLVLAISTAICASSTAEGKWFKRRRCAVATRNVCTVQFLSCRADCGHAATNDDSFAVASQLRSSSGSGLLNVEPGDSWRRYATVSKEGRSSRCTKVNSNLTVEYRVLGNGERKWRVSFDAHREAGGRCTCIPPTSRVGALAIGLSDEPRQQVGDCDIFNQQWIYSGGGGYHLEIGTRTSAWRPTHIVTRTSSRCET